MQLSHTFAAMSVAFTEENLIGSAGLVPAVGLATQIGLVGLGQEHVKLSGPGRANAGVKLMSIVAGMLAGADSIVDMGQLRHGGMERVFTQMRAPSTLGTFLRCFTFGNVRQVDAVASRALERLTTFTPELVAGIDSNCLIDIDDTIDEVYGVQKQGAEHGYTHIRGLNAQLATISTATAAPVIAGTRLRRGAVFSGHGAPKLLVDVIATAKRCGASQNILVRADSAYYTSQLVQKVTGAGARFSITARQNQSVTRAISRIPADAWTRIQYTQAIPDPDTGELVSAAEVAEIEYTAFASTKNPVIARLIVRRIPERNKDKLAGQDTLFPVWRYHCVFTNNPAPLVEAEVTHRQHAIIEQVFADLKASALANLPSGDFQANGAWLVCASIAFNLTRAIGVNAGGRFARAETATIRARLINIPARIARRGRQLKLYLPDNWLWAKSWLRLWAKTMTPATP
ncbi:MAG: IS1380 family transposase [Pseudomonadota bacterium]|nr:IS1380 family transposase [Pseudomonadota bacterium]